MTTLPEIAVGLRKLADLLDTLTAPEPPSIAHGSVTIQTCTPEEWWAWRDLLGPDAEVSIDGVFTWVRLYVTADVRLCVYGSTSMLCEPTEPTELVLAPRPEAAS